MLSLISVRSFGVYFSQVEGSICEKNSPQIALHLEAWDLIILNSRIINTTIVNNLSTNHDKSLLRLDSNQRLSDALPLSY